MYNRKRFNISLLSLNIIAIALKIDDKFTRLNVSLAIYGCLSIIVNQGLMNVVRNLKRFIIC